MCDCDCDFDCERVYKCLGVLLFTTNFFLFFVVAVNLILSYQSLFFLQPIGGAANYLNRQINMVQEQGSLSLSLFLIFSFIFFLFHPFPSLFLQTLLRYPQLTFPSPFLLLSFEIILSLDNIASGLEGLVEEKTKHREVVMDIIQQKINSAGLQQQRGK